MNIFRLKLIMNSYSIVSISVVVLNLCSIVG